MSKSKIQISKQKFLVLSFALCALSFTLDCFARDVNFEITVGRHKVSLGEPLELNLTFSDTQNMPALQLPPLEGFQLRYLGPSTRMSIVNGKVSSSITHVYTLLPTKEGIFKIGPFKLEYNNDNYSSNSIDIEVVKGPVQGAPSESQQGSEAQDLSDRIFLRVQAQKNKIYLNENVPVTAKLYVNRLGVRDIEYPQLIHEGMSLAGFDQPKQYRDVINGVGYDVIEFNTNMFGVRPGEFRLGPATLKCNLIVRKEPQGGTSSSFDDFFGSDFFNNFFGRYETYPLNLKSPDIPITVLALPEENRPQDFSGAIGDFDMEVSLAPEEVKVADPVTLKVIIKGEGNFNTVNPPEIKSDRNFKVYEPQAKQEKGRKIFEQILLPMNAAVKELPALYFSFFDPKTAQYRTLTKGPFALKVLKPEKEEELKIIESTRPGMPAFEEKLGRDIVYIKDSLGGLRKKGEFVYKNKMFLWLQMFPLLVFLLLFGFHARSEKLRTDIRYARQLKAPGKAKQGLNKAKGYLGAGKTREFYDTVFQTLQEYLGDKFHFASQSITISIVDDNLKGKSYPPQVLDQLRSVFSDCDMARFAASEFSRADREKTLKNLQEVIDYFQRNKVL
ncbi:MAG: BatD family protein [Candidatus Omnitrophota bacterium]